MPGILQIDDDDDENGNYYSQPGEGTKGLLSHGPMKSRKKGKSLTTSARCRPTQLLISKQNKIAVKKKKEGPLEFFLSIKCVFMRLGEGKSKLGPHYTCARVDSVTTKQIDKVTTAPRQTTKEYKLPFINASHFA